MEGCSLASSYSIKRKLKRNAIFKSIMAVSPFRPARRRSVASQRLKRFGALRFESFLSAALALVLLILIANLFIPKHKADVIDVSDVSAFQIPYESFRQLKSLSEEKRISFPELLSVYCQQEGYFPLGKAPLAVDDFISSLKSVKKPNDKESNARLEMLETILGELERFPIAWDYNADNVTEYTYTDTWGAGRAYGGERIHEGTDILDKENERGRLSVVSMTAGKVASIGWNELGGYSVGIRTEKGTYYYYAHLDHFAPGLKEGDEVMAGQLIAYMGDSGYGKEGTRGQFPVHLHVGVSPKVPFSDDFWINPYPFLRDLEERQMSS
jgi:murein DD-endopeptidase MepM/ murein hydrolase activator NlpD